MTAYYKATRLDGTDFRTGTIDYAAALASGEVIRHPGEKVRNRPETYLSVSVEPADCTGFSWPCRLFRVEPEGFAWLAVVDEGWTTSPGQIAGRRCRWGSPKAGYHGVPAEAVLFRGSRRRPYGYCSEHLYGRWIEDGEVKGWRLRKVSS